MSKLDFIQEEFRRRRQNNQMRRLRLLTPRKDGRVEVDGVPMLNFCANDYLGLSGHPLLAQRAREFLDRYGAGATASRLICGNYDGFAPVEQTLARLKQTESALLLNSGFQANTTLIPTLCDRQTVIYSDALNHNSIIQGCRLARARVEPFAHNDLADLETRLQRADSNPAARRLIVTETVFSMDGDVCDLDRLVWLAQTYQALLVVDEAHATGVLGPNGMGAACGQDVDVVIGTFGKSGGAFGAYVACSRDLRAYFINCCPGFIYSTALPPPVLGEISAALELIPTMAAERRDLLDKAEAFRLRMARLGLSTGASSTQIIPVLVGAESRALDLSRWLETQGFLAVAIRPPTVPPGESRLRISLSARHTRSDVMALADAIEAWHEKEAR